MGGKSYYYLTDATGNVLGLVDDSGKRTHIYAYAPTGPPRGTTAEAVPPQPYRYAGAYADPTGLYKMGHRYYDPTLGRFTQPDPSGQESNPYLYAAGDPINNSDPHGLLSLGGVLEGFGIGLTLGALVASGPLGIGLGVAAAGADIAGAAVSGASGSEIAGVAVVSAFTLGVGGGASALAKGNAAAGRAATGVDAGYAALGYGANKLITSEGVCSMIFAAGGASSGSTVVSAILGIAFLVGIVLIVVAKNRRR
ncbi:hypothetical protein F6Q10_09805 [Streptomyces vinaceus]|nr:hypothetical protein [Streptomyces vinaceus]